MDYCVGKNSVRRSDEHSGTTKSQSWVFEKIVGAGINDWGGVSPVTPDFVNPEAPWPHLIDLADRTRDAGKLLLERLALYPSHANDPDKWVDPSIRPLVLQGIDGSGFARTDSWSAGDLILPPQLDIGLVSTIPRDRASSDITHILEKL